MHNIPEFKKAQYKAVPSFYVLVFSDYAYNVKV